MTRETGPIYAQESVTCGVIKTAWPWVHISLEAVQSHSTSSSIMFALRNAWPLFYGFRTWNQFSNRFHRALNLDHLKAWSHLFLFYFFYWIRLKSFSAKLNQSAMGSSADTMMNLFQSNPTWATGNSFLIIKFHFNVVHFFQITYMPYSWIRIKFSLFIKLSYYANRSLHWGTNLKPKIKTSYTKTAGVPSPRNREQTPRVGLRN